MTQCSSEGGNSVSVRVAGINAARFAAQQADRRRAITPEYRFPKHFDNSRLVKAADPVRVRQMRVFVAASVVFFTLAMFYALQHFSVIEMSYKVEAEKQYLSQLKEENRQLTLRAAQLSYAGRLDEFARNHGLVEPQPGQVVSASLFDANAPTVAQASAPAGDAR